MSVFSVLGAEGLEKMLTTATLAPVPWGWEEGGWASVMQSVWTNVLMVAAGFYGLLDCFYLFWHL